MKSRLEMMQERVARCQEELANFARIQEELQASRKRLVGESAREKLDGVIKLNRELVANMRRSLALTEDQLEIAERDERAARIQEAGTRRRS